MVMESLLPHIKVNHYSLPFVSIPMPKTTTSFILLQPNQAPHTPSASRSLKLGSSRQHWPQNGRFVRGLVVECGKGGGQFVEELGSESEYKINLEEDEWAGIEENWRGNCDGGKGIVELMECLEREAIMGEDQGTDPADYNRRAHIFDKSSKVFQALKDNQP